MPQTIQDWKADYTGADTNLPTADQSPTVGPELREIKAVIRGETLNKFFQSDKIDAFYLSGDDTFYVDNTAFTEPLPTDADFLPGECMLLSLLSGGATSEYWAVVKTVTLGPGIVTFSVFTGVHLNGTDGTLTHIRRSIYKPPVHPSSAVDPAYIETLQDVSSLPARVGCTYARCKDPATSFKVAFPWKIPAAYNIRIFATCIGGTTGFSVGSQRIKSITHDELEATITVQAAAGATFHSVWLITVYVE